MEIQPSNQPSDLEIAWAAGLFEGEGCFSAGHRKKTGKAIVVAMLGTTDRDVLEKFAAIVGSGAIYERRPGTRGHKPMFEWRIQEALKVISIIELFLPHLGERRTTNARRVLEIARTIQPHNVKKTHCPKGHPLEGENLLLEPYTRNGVRYFARRCRACGRIQSRERMRRVHNTQPENYRFKE